MLKIGLKWFRGVCLVGLLFNSTSMITAFDAFAARAAIDTFSQAFSAAPISSVATSLAALDAMLTVAATSAYITNVELAAVVESAKNDVNAIRSVFRDAPIQDDVAALEDAYSGYVSAIESSKLQATLAVLQSDSGQAIKAAIIVVQDLVAALETARALVVVNGSISQQEAS